MFLTSFSFFLRILFENSDWNIQSHLFLPKRQSVKGSLGYFAKSEQKHSPFYQKSKKQFVNSKICESYRLMNKKVSTLVLYQSKKFCPREEYQVSKFGYPLCMSSRSSGQVKSPGTSNAHGNPFRSKY